MREVPLAFCPRVRAGATLLLIGCGGSAGKPQAALQPAPSVTHVATVSAPRPALVGLRVDDDAWFPYAGVNLLDRRGTALDASDLLDAPAGKHGRVVGQGEGFVFANGRRVRFVATAIAAEANFPSHEQADFMAEFCAQLGVNQTVHRLSVAALDTSAERLEHLDYLLAALGQRGIYARLDFGAEPARAWLTRENPHKRLAPAADPALLLDDWTEASAEASSPDAIGELAARRVAAAPHIVSLIARAEPAARADAWAKLAAFSGLHAWNPLFGLLAETPLDELSQTDCKLTGGSAAVFCQAGLLALLPALARSVLRGDVKESPSAAGAPSDFVVGSIATSVTGELMTDSGKDLFKFDSPRSQGVVGVTLGRSERVSNLTVSVKNPSVTLLATSLDGRVLARSARILISAVGNAVNRGTRLASTRQRWQEQGDAPVLLEPIVGSVELTGLTGDVSDVRVMYLSPSGQRLGSVPIEKRPGNVRFELEARYRSLHYEVLRGESSP
jgi:hypothetical protein